MKTASYFSVFEQTTLLGLFGSVEKIYCYCSVYNDDNYFIIIILFLDIFRSSVFENGKDYSNNQCNSLIAFFNVRRM